MFGLEYLLALSSVLTRLGFAIITAIPVYFSWNCIAPKYLVPGIGLPAVFASIPYWHVVAFLLCATLLGGYMQKLVPTIVKINNSSDSKSKNKNEFSE